MDILLDFRLLILFPLTYFQCNMSKYFQHTSSKSSQDSCDVEWDHIVRCEDLKEPGSHDGDGCDDGEEFASEQVHEGTTHQGPHWSRDSHEACWNQSIIFLLNP